MLRVFRCLNAPTEVEAVPASITLANLGQKSLMCQRESLKALAGVASYESEMLGKSYAGDMPAENCRGMDENDLWAMQQHSRKKINKWQEEHARKKKEEED